MKIKRCRKCIMPETKPGISFNEEGVCNACVNTAKEKEINWSQRMQELLAIADEVRQKKPTGYNCLVPVSGGKDSTFMAMFVRDKLKLNPICVYSEPCVITERGDRNVRNFSKLGFDIIRFMCNQKIMPTLLKKSLEIDGCTGLAFDFILYSFPTQMAIKYQTPLIVWAENPQFAYGNTEVDVGLDVSVAKQKDNCLLESRDADSWAGDGVEAKDLLSLQCPSAEELEGVKAIYLGYYLKLDARRIADFALRHGLSVRTPDELLGTGGYWGFEQLDDEAAVISHMLKYLKYGYGRATDQACRDIRWGYITRGQGIRLAKKYDGHCNPEYIRRWCGYVGMTVAEFWEIADKFRDPRIWKQENGVWKLDIQYEDEGEADRAEPFIEY